MPKPVPTEHQEQAAYFQWVRAYTPKDRRLALLHAIPNGGLRHKREAIKLKAEGVKPGVPDTFLPVPIQPWHGLYIEFKTRAPNTKASRDQRDTITALHHQGYFAVVCKGWEAAREVTLDYLKGSPSFDSPSVAEWAGTWEEDGQDGPLVV